MPNRIVREGILTSEPVDSLSSWAAEVFYRRLMSVVDDYGRYFASASLLRAACYPLRLDKVSNADVEKWLAECAGAALVSTYEVGGKKYLQLLNFKQRIRQDESCYPPPKEQCQPRDSHVRADPEVVHLSLNTLGSFAFKDAEQKSKLKPRARARKIPMPADFEISDRVKTWSAQRGFDRLDEHLEAFKRKAAARGYEYIDWEAAFMEAVREDWAKIRSGAGQPQKGKQEALETRNREVAKAWAVKRGQGS